ncbi:hypothetical protein VP01_2239g4 [Puccinia sorghi]|uniref:Uncharacterized protein n=1 Tax=Puccinia sorghi TaxID=27349 RepID=A0A0L6V8R9_9BASI|nr:hypothetical protein VP01_2239g4 [Puccinia sorghi]
MSGILSTCRLGLIERLRELINLVPLCWAFILKTSCHKGKGPQSQIKNFNCLIIFNRKMRKCHFIQIRSQLLFLLHWHFSYQNLTTAADNTQIFNKTPNPIYYIFVNQTPFLNNSTLLQIPSHQQISKSLTLHFGNLKSNLTTAFVIPALLSVLVLSAFISFFDSLYSMLFILIISLNLFSLISFFCLWRRKFMKPYQARKSLLTVLESFHNFELAELWIRYRILSTYLKAMIYAVLVHIGSLIPLRTNFHNFFIKTSKVYEKWFEKVVKGPNVSWANRFIVKILNFDHHGPFVVFRGFQHSAFRHRSPPNLGFQSMKKKKTSGGNCGKSNYED